MDNKIKAIIAVAVVAVGMIGYTQISKEMNKDPEITGLQAEFVGKVGPGGSLSKNMFKVTGTTEAGKVVQINDFSSKTTTAAENGASCEVNIEAQGQSATVIVDITREPVLEENIGYPNEKLNNAKKGDTVRVTDTTFNGVEDASVDITISDILNMPYPVTDDYIQNNTEYDSVHDMCSALKNDASGEAKEIAREHTINSLIDTMMEQTTFIQLPESLIQRELEVLQKDDPNATYEQAKHSLYKIFFIASVIKNDGVATKTDLEKRYEKLDKSEKEGLSKYEIERKKYILFEEDVVTSIYKKVQINSQESSTGDSDAAEIDNTEDDDNSIE